MSVATAKAPRKSKAGKNQPKGNEIHSDIEQDPETRPLDRLPDPERVLLNVAIDTIDEHESNRDITVESVVELAESLRELGQLEPVTIRHGVKPGRYTLISGGRRFKAIKFILGWQTIRAVIVSEETPQSLVRLAAANTQRKDLNPIERAQLIETLMKPVDEGGSGLDRLAAGRAVGLNSDSGVKNTLRLLKLPATVQSLVAKGEMPERAARRLIPLIEFPEIVREIERHLSGKSKDVTIEDLSDDEWAGERYVRDLIEKHTRPLDARKIRAHNLVQGCWGEYPMLFELGEHDWQPKEIMIDGKKHTVTCDVKHWDKLQKPLVEKQWAKSTNTGRKGKTSTKPAAKGKEPTAAEKLAEQKRKDREAEQRLAQFTRRWKSLALRLQTSIDATMLDRLLSFGWLHAHYNGLSRSQICDIGYTEAQITMADTTRKRGSFGARVALPKRAIAETQRNIDAMNHLQQQWRIMLWPASNLLEESSHVTAGPIAAVGMLPDIDRMARELSDDSVDELAAFCGVTLKDFWRAAATDAAPQRQLLALWLSRHTSKQLNSYITEAKLKTTGTSRAELVEYILAQHKPGKCLPMPKRLER